jgi:RNA polymerase sigma-70 factor (ECF subfamily)
VNGSGADPLLEGLAAGNERSFEILYDRFSVRMFRAALRMLGSREDAEDAVQDVFLSAVRSRERLGDVRDLTAYLFAALHRAAGKLALRRGKAVPVCTEAAEQAVAPAAQSESDDFDWLRVQEAIQRLPYEQREVMTLKIDGELTFAQIAQVMGVGISTASSRYHYALQKLRNSLLGAPTSLGESR